MPAFDKVFRHDQVHDFLQELDYLIAALPQTAATDNLLDAASLAKLPAHAYLINVGRGNVVDTGALIDALKNGRLAGAALDVFQTEPPGDHPLLSLDNFVATPHVAAQTLDAQQRVGEDVLEIIRAFSSGRSLSGLGIIV